jgi:phage protein D
MSSDRSSAFYSVLRLPPGQKTGELTDVTDRVTNFVYEDRENGTDKLSLTVDNFDLKQFDEEIFVTGGYLQVAWGVGSNVAQTRRMLIKKVTGGMTLQVEAHNEASVMDSVYKRRVFKSVRRSDVVRKIVEEYRIRAPDIQDSDEVFDEIAQSNLTDAQFIRKLAHLEGYQFYLDANGVHFHERRIDQAPRKEYIWYTDPKEGEIISFSIENDVTRRPSQVKVCGRDPLTKERICGVGSNKTDLDRYVLATNTATGSYPDLTPDEEQLLYDQGAVSNATVPTGMSYALEIPSNVQTKADAEREAKKRFRLKAQGIVKLNMSLRGDPSFQAKTIIKVSGLGKRISGKYYVKKVKHSLSASGGYTLSVETITDGYQAKKKVAPDVNASLEELANGLAELTFAEISTKVGPEGQFNAADPALKALFRQKESIVNKLRATEGLTGDAKQLAVQTVLAEVKRFGQDCYQNGSTKTGESAALVASVLTDIATSGDSQTGERARGKLNTKDVPAAPSGEPASTADRSATPVEYVDTDSNTVTRYENNNTRANSPTRKPNASDESDESKPLFLL